MPVLDRQGDQAGGATGDVPGQAPPEARGSDAAVGVDGNGLAGQPVTGCLPARPGNEVLDPVPERACLQGAVACPAALVMGLLAEQQVPVGDHALQDPDGVDDRRDGHPGSFALGAAGQVVAVLVGGGLELAATD